MSSLPAQARFFTNLQHLLTEGEFVSTYKYALLIALARWAVENPDHDERVPLAVGDLAEHFLALYWPQARPCAANEAARAVAEPRPAYGSVPDEGWRAVLDQDRGWQRPRVTVSRRS